MRTRAVSYSYSGGGGSTPGSNGQIVDTGSYGSPQSVTTNIVVPTNNRARIYVVGPGGVVDPTIGNGTLTQELYIVGTDNTNTVQLDTTTNLILSGTIVFNANTMLSLQWVSGLSAWLEVARNEI